MQTHFNRRLHARALAPLLLATLPTAVLFPAEPPPLPANFEEMQQVAEWSVMLTLRKHSGRRGREGEGLTIYTTNSTFEHQSADGIAQLRVQGPAAIMRSSLPPDVVKQMKALGLPLPEVPTNIDDAWTWDGVARGALQVDDRYVENETHSGKVSNRTRRGDDETPTELTLKINFTKKTYSVMGESPRGPKMVNLLRQDSITGKPIEVVEREDDGAGNVTEKREMRTVRIAVNNQPLPTTGTTLKGRIRRNTGGRTFEEIRWQVMPKSKLPQVYFDRADDTFLPEPGSTAGVMVRWDHGQPDEIEIRLSNVSREVGTCLNSADQSTDPDVAFAAGQANLTIRNNTATTQSPIHRVNLDTKDYAAFAEIGVRARFGNAWVVGKSAMDDKDLVSLVPDDDQNHISDFWQSQVGADKQTPEWDEDMTPKPPTKKGDGFALFEEYRGLFVRGGGHQRLDPRQMELIVIDPDKLLHPAAWKSATGVAAVFIEPTQHRGQRVNFNSGFAGSKPTYALVMEKITGLTDPNGLAIGNHIWGQTTPDPLSSAPATSRVFVDRPRHGLLTVLHPMIKNAIANPASPDGQELYGYGYNAAMLQRVDAALSNSTVVDRLMEKIIRQVALHEAAHACGIGHHQPDTELGVTDCPMRNFTRKDKLFSMGQELAAPTSGLLPLRIGKLCTSGDNCWSHLQLKP